MFKSCQGFLLATLLGCSISFAAVTGAPVQVEYRISRVHGLVQFALALADDANQAPGLKEIWVRSKFQSDEVKKAVADLKVVSRSLSGGLDFNSAVSSRPQGIGTDSLIVIQSLYARDLKDLALRTLGILPINEERLFINALHVLEPVYNSLVWNVGSRDLHVAKRMLEKIAVRVKLEGLFGQAVRFYHGNWPREVPFVIGLHAIPALKDFKNSTTSTSFASVEVHGIQTGVKLNNVEDDFGVVFHELCHSIYGSQSTEFMMELEKWFLANKSPYARQAYAHLNEALATALGNSWAYEKARKEPPSESWYNEPTIDAYAKAISPLVNDYVDSARSIDQVFVDKAIDLFAAKLPDSIRNYQSLLNKVTAVNNNSVIKNTDLREIRYAFRVSSFSGGAPFLDQETISSAKNSTGALVVVLGPSETSDFEKMSSQVPFLAGRTSEIKKMPKRSYFASTSGEGRLLLVIKASSLEDFRAALEAMKKAGNLVPNQSVYKY